MNEHKIDQFKLDPVIFASEYISMCEMDSEGKGTIETGYDNRIGNLIPFALLAGLDSRSLDTDQVIEELKKYNNEPVEIDGLREFINTDIEYWNRSISMR